MTQQERKDELETRFHQFIGNRHYSTEHILEFILSEQSKAVYDFKKDCVVIPNDCLTRTNQKALNKVCFVNGEKYLPEDEIKNIVAKAVADVVGPLEQRQKFLNMDGCSCHIYPPCSYCEYEISADEAIDQSLSKAKTYTEAANTK